MIVESLYTDAGAVSLHVTADGRASCIKITPLPIYHFDAVSDVDWLIGELKKVRESMVECEPTDTKAKVESRHQDQVNATTPASFEQVKERFSKMREMLMG